MGKIKDYMEVRIKLNTAGDQYTKRDLDVIAKAEHISLNKLYIEAMRDCVEKHKKDLIKHICTKVKEYGRLADKYSDGSADYVYTVNSIEITATFRRGRDPYYHAKDFDVPPRFYSESRLEDIIDLYEIL